MKKTTMKTRNLLAMTLAVAVLLSSIPVMGIETEAATFPGPNGMSISVERGLTTLTLKGGATVQLTGMLIAKDGGAMLDANGTAYVIYRSGNIYINNYALQGNNALYSLGDSGVISFQTDANGYATGYILSDSTVKSVLTLEQVKQIIGISNKPAESSSKPVESSSKPVESSSKPVESSSKPVESSSKPVESSSKPVESSSKPVESSSKPAESSSKPAESSSKPAESSSKPAESSSKPVESSSKTAVVTGSVKLENGVVTYTDSNNKVYVLMSSNLIDFAECDADGNVYIHLVNGDSYIWSYSLQKNETTPKPVKFRSNVTIFVVNNGKVVGRYETGSTTMLTNPTIAEIQKLIAASSSKSSSSAKASSSTKTTTTTKTATTVKATASSSSSKKTTTTTAKKKVVYAHHVNTHRHMRDTFKRLMNSDNKQVDMLKMIEKKSKKRKKYHTLKYRTKTYKNVYRSEFLPKGNMAYIDKKCHLFVVNHKTLKRTQIEGRFKKFKFSKSFANRAVREDGTIIKIDKY